MILREKHAASPNSPRPDGTPPNVLRSLWWFMLLFAVTVPADTLTVVPDTVNASIRQADLRQQTDQLKIVTQKTATSPTESISADSGSNKADSIAAKADLISVKDTAASTILPKHRATAGPDSLKSKNMPSSAISGEDTAQLENGTYFSVGFGWSLGSFALTEYWENALPDSLVNFGLSDTAFRISVDSTLTAPLLPSDTARLQFSLKEKPAIYTMCFPISFSLITINDHRKLSLSLIGSWMRKVYTATIGLVNDTTDLQVDYKESINVYSLFLSAVYGFTIPSEYFTIEGIEKSFFICGLDLSPLIVTTITTTTKAPENHPRLQKVTKRIDQSDRFFHGGAAALRIGLSMIKRINKNNATDAGFYYTIQGYGYFFEDGQRVAFNDIDTANRKKGRPLFWISNRFELSIALLRCHGK